MHILLGLVGILGTIGTLLWYFSRAKHGADDVIDTVERAAGAWRRHKFHGKAERPALETEDDPRAAAAALAVSLLQSCGQISAADEVRLQKEFETVMGVEDSTDLLAYARWLVKDTVDPNTLTSRLAGLLIKELGEEQKIELVDMLTRLSGDDPIQVQALSHLRTRLGL